MRYAWLAAVAVPLALAGAPAAQASDRGPYVAVMMTGSEPSGPKPTASTDLDGFSGVGLSAAVGYRWLPLRVELEYQGNTAYWIGSLFSGSGDDRIQMKTLMLNAIVEAQLNGWLGVFFGAGFGQADVRADFVTCLQLQGCLAPAESHASGSASARQTQLGVTVGPFHQHQVVIGFRWLKSGRLGLADTAGRPFEEDRAKAKMSFVGWRGSF
ncbi:MAG TPA: outer membrane beta-barrel protein [Burkholderiales bacterium]|jgi:opacity protein-like surface antigen|nr:outer membrane beta-barrel protein [Burkholderiales bacterium]